MKKLITLILLCAGVHMVSFAQDFQLPLYTFKTAENCIKYEPKVLDACNWALTTPVTEQPNKRMQVDKFVVEWVQATPTVMINTENLFMDLFSVNPEYGPIYVEGFVQYLLNSKKSDGTLNTEATRGFNLQDDIDANYAAICAVMDFYKQNKDVIGENRTIERYIGLNDKDKVKEIIEKVCVRRHPDEKK